MAEYKHVAMCTSNLQFCSAWTQPKPCPGKAGDLYFKCNATLLCVFRFAVFLIFIPKISYFVKREKMGAIPRHAKLGGTSEPSTQQKYDLAEGFLKHFLIYLMIPLCC